MKALLLRRSVSTYLQYLLGALSLFLLVSCALPYTPRDISSPLGGITDILNSPALRIPIFLAGLALLLAGLWLAEFIIAVPGFILGAIIGAGIGTASNDGDFGFLSFILAIVGGAIGAWLALALFYLGVFLSGFAIGFVVGGSLGASVFNSSDGAATIGIILGIIAGIVAVALWKFLQIVISAGVGTVLIGIALGISDKPVLLIVIWLFGIASQSGLLKIFGPPQKATRPGGQAISPPPVVPPVTAQPASGTRQLIDSSSAITPPRGIPPITLPPEGTPPARISPGGTTPPPASQG